jgi:hypothetical protein
VEIRVIGRPLLFASLAIWGIVGSAALAASAQPAQETAAKLAEEFTDPLTTLPQIFLRDTYSPATYGTHVQTNQTVLRAIIPRIPAYSLLPFVQLVRPTFSLVTVPSSKGGARTELGDTQLFDLAVMPWPGKDSGFRVGIGPMFVFPTATSKSAGQSSWQAGPAFAVVYTGVPGLLAGFLFQEPISFAYSSPGRAPLNTIEVQPAIIFHVWRGWYLRSADATWSYGCHRHTSTTLPLSVGIGDVMVRPGLPPINFYVAGQWTAYRQYAPVTSQTSVVFGATIAFPELRQW